MVPCKLIETNPSSNPKLGPPNPPNPPSPGTPPPQKEPKLGRATGRTTGIVTCTDTGTGSETAVSANPPPFDSRHITPPTLQPGPACTIPVGSV